MTTSDGLFIGEFVDRPVFVMPSLQNLTEDECSEDKMNNLKFYLNQFPSAPDGISPLTTFDS